MGLKLARISHEEHQTEWKNNTILIDTPGHARGPKCITASVEADLNPGVLEAQRIF